MKSDAHLPLPGLRRSSSLLLCVALAACSYSNPHGSQALEPVHRLVTEPRGATVELEQMNRVYESPCDLPDDVPEDEVVRITKEGYLPYYGPLRALPEIARGTRRCVLRAR